MFRPTQYLRWARRFYGRVPFDLASSGMTRVLESELGPLRDLDDPHGWEALRGAIARYNDVPKDEAIAALGTTHALWVAYATLLSPGDDALVESPGYEPLERIAEGVGARVIRFERTAADGWALDPSRVARAITPRTRAVVVTNLHNPTGVRASDSALRDIARIAEARGAHLIVDEVYAPFDALVDASGVFRGSARRLAGNVVVVSSLTKCYGLGDDRFGWVLGPSDVIERAADTITASCGSLPLSHAHRGVRAFERIVPLAERARALLGKKRDTVAKWIATRPELTWSAPTDGLFGLAMSTRAGDLTTIIEQGTTSHGVLVAAGSFFGVPNGFRLSWSIAENELGEALSRLAEILPRA
jgi:aspartate/methionine/tyrosine aminotransferase